MDENKGSLSDRELDLLTAEEAPMSIEIDGKTMMMTPSEIADMENMDSTGGRAIPAEQNMGDMPMMSEEEKRVFMELFEKGIPEDMIIDIMASAKVGATLPATAVNPSEFGGLPNTGSSPASGNPSMPTGSGAMTNQDMSMYLQNKVNEIRGRTGGSPTTPTMGALPLARPNTLTDPSLNERTSNPNMNQPMNT